ncbi:MAG: rhamnulose-1-phosphate aldolase [Oligoflexales bacterium]|nr:rhamnulose-1-phosphate aldolase [Oligoflexales bacterium]
MNDRLNIVLDQVREVSGYIWQKGWAERNAGNISVNVTDECKDSIRDLSSSSYVRYEGIYPALGDSYFFLSGTGLRIRDLAKDIPSLKRNACILKIDSEAKGYHMVWGGEAEYFRPTSEFISHLSIHMDLIRRNTGHKAIVHTHPQELIALTHSEKYCKSGKQITDYLWRMLPEVRAFVPKGLSLIPYALPGSKRLAELTVKALPHCNVALWEKHGALATGPDIIEAFDFIDVANKGAIIFLKCLSAGYVPKGLSDGEIDELVRAFKL